MTLDTVQSKVMGPQHPIGHQSAMVGPRRATALGVLSQIPVAIVSAACHWLGGSEASEDEKQVKPRLSATMVTLTGHVDASENLLIRLHKYLASRT
jgi:hypothetical protein